MSLFEKEKAISITVSNQTAFRLIFVVVGTLLFLRFIDNISRPLELILVSAFLAVALNPAVSWITRNLKSKSRVRGTAVAYLAVLTVLIAFFTAVIPPIVSQTTRFFRDLPQTLDTIEQNDTAVARFINRYELTDEIQNFGRDVSSKIIDYRSPILSTASRLGGTVVSLITVLVLTFMMLVEGPTWANKFWLLSSKGKREHRQEIAEKMYRVVTGYANGQLIIALIAGSFALVALLIASSVFGVTVNALALASIVALTALIPMIGATIGSVIVVLVTLFSSTGLALTMLVYFLVYQQIENVTIQPHIQSRSNSLTPLLVFLAAILGIGLGGLLGALIAIPVAGCLKILVQDYLYNHRQNS